MIFAQFAIFGLSAIWSESRYTTMSETLHFIEYLVLALHLTWRYSFEHFLKILMRLSAIAAFASLFVALAFPKYGLSNMVGEYSNAWRGVFESKNALGGATATGMVACGFAWAMRTNNRWFVGLTILVNIFLLYKARSATSDVATLASACVGLWIWPNGARWAAHCCFSAGRPG